MTRVLALIVGACVVLALVWFGARALDGPRAGDDSTVPAGEAARTAARTSDAAVPELTPEQERELERVATLGYVSGTDEPPETTGVLVHAPGEAFDGLTLFTCAEGAEAFLIDMDGDTVFSWSHPGAEYWARAHLLPGGQLLIVTGRPYRLMKLDRDSTLLWRYDRTAHHDLDVRPDGSIAVIVREAVSFPHINDGMYVLDDHVVLLSPEGQETGRASVLSAFENSSRYPDWLTEHDLPEDADIFHTNSIQMVERDGRLQALLSIRAISTIALLDMESEKMVWAAAGSWHRQHEAVFAGENILFFDNLGAGERSRVLELDFETLNVVWSYTADGFFSQGAGAQQRLPNGNTLITESNRGRIIEVSASGEIVWEYVNPRTVMHGSKELTLGIKRAERIPHDFPLDPAGE